MFTSPHKCGLCTHHIRSSTDPGLLYFAEWLCPRPLFPSKHFLLDTPMLVHDMPFILATFSMYQEVIILKQHFCILMPYKQ